MSNVAKLIQVLLSGLFRAVRIETGDARFCGIGAASAKWWLFYDHSPIELGWVVALLRARLGAARLVSVLAPPTDCAALLCAVACLVNVGRCGVCRRVGAWKFVQHMSYVFMCRMCCHYSLNRTLSCLCSLLILLRCCPYTFHIYDVCALCVFVCVCVLGWRDLSHSCVCVVGSRNTSTDVVCSFPPFAQLVKKWWEFNGQK